MRVISNNQIHGKYGTKLKNEEFSVDDELGEELVARGSVRRTSTFSGLVKAIQPKGLANAK